MSGLLVARAQLFQYARQLFVVVDAFAALVAGGLAR